MTELSTTLNLQECTELLKLYLKGIMTTGLLQPLAEISKKSSGRVGMAAKSWYDLQVQGSSPQKALSDLRPAFPIRISQLLTLGFEKSALDIAIQDILAVIRDSSDIEINEKLDTLKSKFLKFNVDVICSDCWNDELSKIITRARIEGAKEIILEQEGDFFHQKYVAVKLVRISEAAIPEVRQSLKNILSVSASKEISVGQSTFKISKEHDNEYLLENSQTNFHIRFL